MKILFVSFRFPPYNSIGAVRSGKTAKYLSKKGNKLFVLSAANQGLSETLKVEIEEDCITRTLWLDVNNPVKVIMGGQYSKLRKESERATKVSMVRKTIAYGKQAYKTIIHFPDGQIGWYPYAVSKGTKLIYESKPDIIYASAGPYTSLLVAEKLSKRSGIPWVAEFRDLWMDNHYRQYGPIRNTLEGILERKTLKTASGFVTVSQPLADILKVKYPKPTEVITNGFDPDDYESGLTPDPGNPVRIVYTGSIYQGKRDPSPLLEAIGKLGAEKVNVTVDFYGERLALVGDLAEKYGCRENVQVYPSVSYEESLRIQQKADVLLLLLWNDPREKGVFTGKVFEYLGAKRPILVVGPEDNVASQTILERQAGTLMNEPGAIARQLLEWIKSKRENGMVPPPPADALKGFTREEQTRRLGEFLESIISEGRRGK